MRFKVSGEGEQPRLGTVHSFLRIQHPVVGENDSARRTQIGEPFE